MEEFEKFEEEFEEMEKVICDIKFYSPEGIKAKAIREEITSKIMSNAFDHVFEEKRYLFIPDLEGKGYSAAIRKCEEGYFWEFQDDECCDEWYCESRAVDLEKLENIVSYKKDKPFKWLSSPYTSAPFRQYDPEAEWIWNKIQETESYSKFLSKIEGEEKITQGFISISDWWSFKSFVYTLAEEVPSLAFELISLNKKGKEALNEGIKALQARCHYWLLKQGIISNLISYSDSEYLYSDTSIRLHSIETFVSINFWRKKSFRNFSKFVETINKLFSECLLTDFSLPIEESQTSVTCFENKGALSLTAPINSTNPNHPKTLGEIKLDFILFKEDNELLNALEGASQDEVRQYLIDCYQKADYTQDGVFAEKQFYLDKVTWFYQNQEIVLVDYSNK